MGLLLYLLDEEESGGSGETGESVYQTPTLVPGAHARKRGLQRFLDALVDEPEPIEPPVKAAPAPKPKGKRGELGRWDGADVPTVTAPEVPGPSAAEALAEIYRRDAEERALAAARAVEALRKRQEEDDDDEALLLLL